MKRKIFIIITVVAVVAVLGILGVHFFMSSNDDYDVDRYDLSEELYCLSDWATGETKVYLSETDKCVGNYDHVYNTSEYEYNDEWLKRNSAVVEKEGLRGYISLTTGELLVEPKYSHAWIDDPQSGLAACVDPTTGKLGFINIKTKQVVIPFKFDYNSYRFDYVFHYGR